MRHRRWFLYVAVAFLLFGFLFIRLPFIISTFYPTYGDADIAASTHIAIACGLIWLALEVLARTTARRTMRCECGYKLTGLKCPECGNALSE